MSRKSESQMKKDKIWIFAGTTEGRLLTRYASQMKMKCCVSTATEYGKSVLGENEGIRVIPGRMQPIRLQDKLQKIFAPHAKKKRSNMFAVFGKEKRTIRLIMREKRVTEDPYLRLR